MAKIDETTQIKELLEIIRHKVDSVQTAQMGQGASVRLLRDQVSMMNSKFDKMQDNLNDVKDDLNGVKENLNEVKETQTKRVLPPVMYIEATVKSYADAYKENNRNIRKLDKRLDLVEDGAGIEVPVELQLADVA